MINIIKLVNIATLLTFDDNCILDDTATNQPPRNAIDSSQRDEETFSVSDTH